MMKFQTSLYICALLIGLAACTKDTSEDGLFSTFDSYTGAGSGNGGSGGSTSEPGLITAGEWNDLDHWDFWKEILKKKENNEILTRWGFDLNKRIEVRLADNSNKPVINSSVDLMLDGEKLFTGKTDSKGVAELWPDYLGSSMQYDPTRLSMAVNNAIIMQDGVREFEEGGNDLVIQSAEPVRDQIEISFVVDATGSMGDELEFLKTELNDVIERVKSNKPSFELVTSAVFYRDEGDEYVTRVSPFTSNVSNTIQFIQAQKAYNGGDTPEAVDAALDKAIYDLDWSDDAKTRVLFLVLDASPHYKPEVLSKLKASVMTAAQKGIRIVPVTASGIEKDTEFLMRAIAVVTNGTYVFITNHSGIGNSHLEATVGEYEVEYLNDLMVRLINQYAE